MAGTQPIAEALTAPVRLVNLTRMIHPEGSLVFWGG